MVHGLMKYPGLVISALRGGSGKTIVSLGIVAALRDLGIPVAPFKKGPDYIDAGWLGLAAGRPCYNLDTFLLDPETVRHSFCSHFSQGDIAVIEGNRGLFDAIDTEGSTSTAELAKLLDLPVVLCLDCTKITRTMAAVVSGCQQFDPDVKLAGVILNRVAGARHERILHQSISEYCGLPVLGALPKLGEQHFPERHMGLVPMAEHAWAAPAVAAAARMANDHLDLAAIRSLAEASAGVLNAESTGSGISQTTVSVSREERPRIGVIRDSAFQFYYPENIEALVSAGGEVVMTSPLTDAALPSVDGLYIGGGFPETHAEPLAAAREYREAVRRLAEDGMPIYAECGGLMFLGEALELEGRRYEMAGVLPIVFGLSPCPQGHGYTLVTVARENPYFPMGAEIRGHEFHYSTVKTWRGGPDDFAFRMTRGRGIVDGLDGMIHKNVLATYSHTHALGQPGWADRLVDAAARFRKHQDNR